MADKRLEAEVEVTPSSRYFATYYPKQGEREDVVRTLGGKVEPTDEEV